MNFLVLLIVYTVFNPSLAFALGGGATVGPEASKANAHFPFVMLGMLVIIALISRLTK